MTLRIGPLLFGLLAIAVVGAAAWAALFRGPRGPARAPAPNEVAGVGAAGEAGAAGAVVPDVRRAPRFDDIGPRIISNQTRYPVVIYGDHLPAGSKLALSSSVARGLTLSTQAIDERHLAAVIPAGIEIGRGRSALAFGVGLIGPDEREIVGRASLTVVDDSGFADPVPLELGGDRRSMFVASATTDEIWVFDRGGDPKAPPRVISAGDGPRALASWVDGARVEWLVVALQYGRELMLIPARNAGVRSDGVRHIPLGADAQDLAVDRARGKAYVSSHEKNVVLMVDLSKGIVEREIAVGVKPGALALLANGTALLVSNLGSEDFSLVELAPEGRWSTRRITARPGTPIIGGSTEKYSRYVIGSKPGRALIWDSKRRVVFVATIGPNIGPNPDRMEVSMNGGVSVIDPIGARYLRHVAIGGVAEALALDEDHGLLYAADSSTGRVVVLDASRLQKSDRAARQAILGSLEIMPPEGTALIRPATDFGPSPAPSGPVTAGGGSSAQGEGATGSGPAPTPGAPAIRPGQRATVSLHSGPKALRLDPKARRLFVLNRFTRTISEIDVSKAAQGKLLLVRTFLGPEDPAGQRERRLGEVVYFTDLGRTGMTCDTCHPEGHAGGVLFTKTTPMRIYRSPTLRGIKESPPYFTPSRLPTIHATCEHVLSRNRYRNPPPTNLECNALTAYVEGFAPPPNPFVEADGTLPKSLVLPDGHRGDPRVGMRLFESKAGCATGACHPPPHFTGDQSPATRGVFHHVGTPLFLPIRSELQDSADYGHPPIALIGAWDTFPLLDSGAAGLSVDADGTLAPTHPFALRRVLELSGGAPPHGNARALSAAETDDLLAYLLTL